MIRLALAALALTGLAGCSSTAFREIGVPPALSPVGSGLAAEGSSIYNYPEKPAAPVKKFSLWDDRQSRLFTDPRALEAGDLLTVLISIVVHGISDQPGSEWIARRAGARSAA